jgi:hypothetical protein
MDRVTESLLAKLTAEHGLEASSEERRFEHFAAWRGAA